MERTSPDLQQHYGLWLVLALLSAAMLLQHYTTPSTSILCEPVTTNQRIWNKVSVNHDSWTSLARLRGIGETRAKEIIKIREIRRRNTSHNPVYNSMEDLDSVPGIGPVTIQNIEPYISFESPTLAP